MLRLFKEHYVHTTTQCSKESNEIVQIKIGIICTFFFPNVWPIKIFLFNKFQAEQLCQEKQQLKEEIGIQAEHLKKVRMEEDQL